jgi:hypothetical protein
LITPLLTRSKKRDMATYYRRHEMHSKSVGHRKKSILCRCASPFKIMQIGHLGIIVLRGFLRSSNDIAKILEDWLDIWTKIRSQKCYRLLSRHKITKCPKLEGFEQNRLKLATLCDFFSLNLVTLFQSQFWIVTRVFSFSVFTIFLCQQRTQKILSVRKWDGAAHKLRNQLPVCCSVSLAGLDLLS